MDFIEQLPSSEGYTDILVIVDRFTKQAILVPMVRTIDATQLAQLFVKHVFSKHGTPFHVTSDCSERGKRGIWNYDCLI